MLLVVDANILFSFFSSTSSRRAIIESSSMSDILLVSPDFVFEELANERDRIIKYAKIDGMKFALVFSILERKIKSIGKEEYSACFSEAERLAPHVKDVPYFALALTFNCHIWSDEIEFKSQTKVRVFSTSELIEYFRL